MWGKNNVLYNSSLIDSGSMHLSLLMIPLVLEHFMAILSIWFFQFKLSFRVKPRKLKSNTFSIGVPLMLNYKLSTVLLIILCTINFDLFTFRDNLFILSQSLIFRSSLFISVSTFTLGFVIFID